MIVGCRNKLVGLVGLLSILFTAACFYHYHLLLRREEGQKFMSETDHISTPSCPGQQ